MTGEMGWNDLKDYPDMLDLAKKIQRGAKVAAEVRPFDVYQGPFIAIAFDMAPIPSKGIKRLGAWNAEVWYDQFSGFMVRYRNHVVPSLPASEVVQTIKNIKATRK